MGNNWEESGGRGREESDVRTGSPAIFGCGSTAAGPRSETTPADPASVALRHALDFEVG